ncbi:hypothetical protein DFJ77DRAFT_225136 [Powellomyces hirtus]|nr:hypothetical protein DFJ77DRAFT_225136 [Powellomyces hirtus]
MSAARPPTSTKQLAQKAAVTDNPNTHSVQIWAKSALSLFEKGEQERQAGDLEGAYIHLFRAISIVGEVIPATNEWQKIKRHREDTGFLAAKRKVPIYLPLMEELKAELKKRFETWQAEQSSPGIVPNGQSQIRRGSSTSSIASNNTAREPRTSISPQELLGLFQQQIKTILVLDVRPMEQFIHGHIKWRIAPGPLAGGVVNLEPEWLDNPSRTIDDIESYLTSFGQSSAIAKTLFDARNKFDMIIFLDDHSTNPDSSPLLRTLMRVLYQSQSKSPRLRPLLLAGGHGAWESYINSIGEFLGDWVEIGEGCGRHIGGGQNLPTSYDSKVSNGSNGSGIARSAYDFVSTAH